MSTLTHGQNNTKKERNVRLEDDVHREVKTLAAQKDTTIQQLVNEACRLQYLAHKLEEVSA